MSSRLTYVLPDRRVLDEIGSDMLVLTTFEDERPLTGLTALVDWRLCGALSRWFRDGFASGRLGERILYPLGRRISHHTLLLFGLGQRAEFRPDRAFAVADATVQAAADLSATTLTCGLFGISELASPLERSGKQLLEVLRSREEIEQVNLVADATSQELLQRRVSLGV